MHKMREVVGPTVWEEDVLEVLVNDLLSGSAVDLDRGFGEQVVGDRSDDDEI